MTSKSIRLLSNQSGALVDEWQSPSGRAITHCTGKNKQLFVASGADLYEVGVDGAHLVTVRYD